MMAGNQSDDDDYMSDKYLSNCTDIRPGLVLKQATKRKIEAEEKHKRANAATKVKSRKVIEVEQREEGLQKALSTENKGFAMLQKMGYKPGSSLGKAGTGRTEPIPVNVKADRGGLGMEEFLKCKRAEVAKVKLRLKQNKQHNLSSKREEFLQYQRNKQLEKITKKDLYNSQKSCMQLDQAMGLDEPAEVWFWPERMQKPDEETDDETDQLDESDSIELEPSEKLEILTEYLRNTHFFCVWCGTVYEDINAMMEACPGNTSDDH